MLISSTCRPHHRQAHREGGHGACFQPSSGEPNLANADAHELPRVGGACPVQSLGNLSLGCGGRRRQGRAAAR
jgi:hypothetical protein